MNYDNQSASSPSQLIIEHKAIPHLFKTEIYAWIKNKQVALISGSGKTRAITEQIIEVISGQASRIQVMSCENNTFETINELERNLLEDTPDLIFGVGGGKALDVSKVVGTRSNVPVVATFLQQSPVMQSALRSR